MSALPIYPTDKEVRDFIVLESETGTGALPKLVRAAFQAGVEAERARAAAETTEEWGVQSDGDSPQPVLHAKRSVSESVARRTGLPLIRRLIGPWEVQS